MKFKLIREELIKEYDNNLKNSLEKLKDEEGLNHVVRWTLNKRGSYKGDFLKQKEKVIKALTNYHKKNLNKKLNLIKSIEEAKDTLLNPLIITLEWNKSKMWGSNPKAYTNYGFIGSSIGGCGYDKTSTATAEALNSQLTILKALCNKEEERLNKIIISKLSKEDKEKFLSRRAFIGYGSGNYNIIPMFEGGVGVDCHRSIINNIDGLKWTNITDTRNINVYMISKD